jgi:hypothetical protein
MKEIKVPTRSAILLAPIASSVAALSTGATKLTAFAQQSAIDFELPDLPQMP